MLLKYEKAKDLSHPDWHTFFDTNTHFGPKSPEVLQALEEWLNQLSIDLDSYNYKTNLFESENFLLLSNQDEGAARDLLNCSEQYFQDLRNSPLNLNLDEGWKVILICLPNWEVLFDYFEYYKMSGSITSNTIGLFLGEASYQHIVLCGDLSSLHDEIRSTIAHELVHYTLFAHEVPVWLDEGLAVLNEKRYFPYETFIDYHVMKDNQEFWSDNENIKGFIDGPLWGIAGAAEYTYPMAETLTKSILDSFDRSEVTQFIQDISLEDGGRKAFEDYWGEPLEELISNIYKTS